MIKVSVYKFNRMAERDCLYSVSVDDNQSLSFPFNNIISVLRVLYPKCDCVTFDVL